MAKKSSLKAALRARTGSGRLTQMRREGWLPSVVYGRGQETKNLKVDAKTFADLMAASSSENIVINLEVEGEGTHLAFLKAIQHDPIRGHALHADFIFIDEKTEITASIPVMLLGESPGVKVGGVLEQYVHVMEIHCLPNDLPGAIEIDISHLQLGESLHVGAVSLPKGVRATHGEDVVIAHIGKSGGMSQEEEDAEAAAAV